MPTLVNVNDPKEVGRQQKRERMSLPEKQQSSDTTRKPITAVAEKNIITYYTTALQQYVTQFNMRPQMMQRDLAYYRENDNTRAQRLAKAANATGDASKVQNVTIPIVMPQTESALAYLTDVFLTGYPIFGIVAPPAQVDAIAQMETIIGDNSIRWSWIPELQKVLRDGLKYDLGALEVTWQKRKIYQISSPEIDELTTGKVSDTVYQGNRLKRLDPYNLILDARVSPEVNHLEGEVAGYTEIVSAVAMKQRMEDLDILCSMNFNAAFNSPSTASGAPGNQTAGYFTPVINPDALLPAATNQMFNWDTFIGGDNTGRNGEQIHYQSAYEWTVLYVRMIPKLFGINTAKSNHVQIWKFIIINQSIVIFAEKQTNAHGMLPIVVCKPSNDGMGYQSKSFSQTAEPYQATATGLFNSAMESQRRKVYDRMFYDANRVNKKDIDSVSSVARIPVKNSQYNKDIASAIHVVPYRDEGVSDILSFSQNVTQMADFATGQNRVQQGQFQKGNKTRKEFDTVMGNSNARQKMSALAIEYTFFAAVKEMVKSNILQYQPPTILLNNDTKSQVKIDPTVLRNAGLTFKVSDGLLPSDKLANSDMFTTFMQAGMAIPELRAEYDMPGMFVYQMKLGGADWLDAFKRDEAGMQQYMASMEAASKAAGTHKNSVPPEQQPQQ